MFCLLHVFYALIVSLVKKRNINLPFVKWLQLFAPQLESSSSALEISMSKTVVFVVHTVGGLERAAQVMPSFIQ